MYPYYHHLLIDSIVCIPGPGTCFNLEPPSTGWWFFPNPFEKYAIVKLGSSSPNRDENKTYWKPPPYTSTSMDPVSCLGRHPVSQVIKLDHFPKSKSISFFNKNRPKRNLSETSSHLPQNPKSQSHPIFPARVTQQLREIPFDQSGQFIINPKPNLRPFWGTLPLLFTTIWGIPTSGFHGRYKLPRRHPSIHGVTSPLFD